jgi:hypothetical protein
MAFISLDSPSCEVPCWILRSVVYRDVTRQANGLYCLKHEVVLKKGLAYLSRCNSGWFCHSEISWLDLDCGREQPIPGQWEEAQTQLRGMMVVR